MLKKPGEAELLKENGILNDLKDMSAHGSLLG